MIASHTQRAAGAGAKATAIVGALSGVALASYDSSSTTPFESIALKYGVVGLLAGAVAGLLAFAAIGFCVALLGVKRVGWTFTYCMFGALVFAFAAYVAGPIFDGAIATFSGSFGTAAAIGVAALVGAVSGIFVAGALKAGPEG